MRKKIITFLAIFLFPLLLITGFASWIIVGEKSETVGTNATTSPVAVFTVTINSVEETKKYTRVEKALEEATTLINTDNNGVTSVTIYIVPGTNPKITQNCTLSTGVSLVLPYALSSDYKTATIYSRAGTNRSFADATPTAIKANLLNNMYIDGASFTINAGATLVIGGVLGDDDVALSGHTSGSYSQITMMNEAKIISRGTINCYGYIKEDYASRNTCTIEALAGQVYQPFVIYDFRGGTNTAIVYRKGNIAPFNVYDLPNIQPTYKIYSTATLTGYADLYASSKHNTTDIKVISTSSSILKLSSGSYVVGKYTPKWVLEDKIYYSTTTIDQNQSETTLDASNSKNYCRTSLDIYGDISTGAMSMSVQGINVSTADVLFPVSWKFDISIHNCEFTLNNHYKLMTGASLTIDSNSIFNIGSSSSMVVYSSFTDVAFGGSVYPSKPAGKLVNNGVMNILGSFGGFIEAKEDNGMISVDSGATLTIDPVEGNSGSSTSIEALFGGGDFVDVPKDPEPASAYIGSKTITNITKPNFYLSKDQIWNINTDTYTVNFYSIVDNGTPNIYGTSTTATLRDGLVVTNPTTQLGNATFVGWYFESTFENEVLNEKVLGSQLYIYSNKNKVLNLYSRWTTGSTVSVKYYDNYSSTAYPTVKTSYNKMANQTITIVKGLDQYMVTSSDNSKLVVYTFEKWQAFYNDQLIEDSLSPGSLYTIPENITSGELLIKPYYSSITYYNISITGSDTDKVKVLGAIEINSKFWAMEGSSITVQATGKTTSLFGYLKTNYTITATISSGQYFEDGTNYVAATGESETKEKTMVMPNTNITIKVTSKRA